MTTDMHKAPSVAHNTRGTGDNATALSLSVAPAPAACVNQVHPNRGDGFGGDRCSASTDALTLVKNRSIGKSEHFSLAWPEPKTHRWDATGERCLACGDKDWFAGPSCTGSRQGDEPPSQPEAMWTHDARTFGDALNEATAQFLQQCPEKSDLLFNSAKVVLRSAIVRYAEIVAGQPPRSQVSNPLTAYADSYRRTAKLGDGRVACSDVAYDIEKHMAPHAAPPAQGMDLGQFRDRIKAAIDRIVNHQCLMRIPVDNTDPDIVLADILRLIDGQRDAEPGVAS